VAVLALAAHVEHLLVLGVGVHARGLQVEAASLRLLLISDAAGLTVIRGLAAAHLSQLGLHHVSPPPGAVLHLIAHLGKRVNGAVAHALVRVVVVVVVNGLVGHVALAEAALALAIDVPGIHVDALAGLGSLDGEGLVHRAIFKHRHLRLWLALSLYRICVLSRHQST